MHGSCYMLAYFPFTPLTSCFFSSAGSLHLSHVGKQPFVGLCCIDEQTEAGDVCQRHPEMNPAVREQRLMLLPLPANLL